MPGFQGDRIVDEFCGCGWVVQPLEEPDECGQSTVYLVEEEGDMICHARARTSRGYEPSPAASRQAHTVKDVPFTLIDVTVTVLASFQQLVPLLLIISLGQPYFHTQPVDAPELRYITSSDAAAMPSRIQHIVPLWATEDPYTSDTSEAEPQDDELSDSDFIEIDDREWTDEELMDDGRPGRRVGESDRVTDLKDIVGQVKMLKLTGATMKKAAMHQVLKNGE